MHGISLQFRITETCQFYGIICERGEKVSLWEKWVVPCKFVWALSTIRDGFKIQIRHICNKFEFSIKIQTFYQATEEYM